MEKIIWKDKAKKVNIKGVQGYILCKILWWLGGGGEGREDEKKKNQDF